MQAFAARWVRSSVDGHCGFSTIGASCDTEPKGSFVLGTSELDNWELAAASCLERCNKCKNCRHVSLSLKHGDCSWYQRCPVLFLGVDSFRSLPPPHINRNYSSRTSRTVRRLNASVGISAAWQVHSSRKINHWCTDVLTEMTRGFWVHDERFCSSEARVLCGSRQENWVWSPATCTLKIFDSQSTCELLQRLGGLSILGESLERMLYMGILNILSGDYEVGALAKRDAAARVMCAGEKQ